MSVKIPIKKTKNGPNTYMAHFCWNPFQQSNNLPIMLINNYLNLIYLLERVGTHPNFVGTQK